MADKVALAQTKMRLKSDENQKKQAEKTLSNLDFERQGILWHLARTHNETERMELVHQLKMVDIQIAGQQNRLVQIEVDKQKQIQKQKEVQDKLQEDQKNWFVRLLDDILGFFGMVFGKIGQFKDAALQKFRDIWNGIVNDFKSIMNSIGGFFQGIWTSINNVLKTGVNFFIGILNHLIDGYNSLPKLGAPNMGHIPSLSSGTDNFAGGMAYVHAGEVLTYLPKGSSVTPAHRVSAALRASGGTGGHTIINNTVTVYAQNANADQVAQKVHTILSRDLRRSGSIGTMTSGGRAAG